MVRYTRLVRYVRFIYGAVFLLLLGRSDVGCGDEGNVEYSPVLRPACSENLKSHRCLGNVQTEADDFSVAVSSFMIFLNTFEQVRSETWGIERKRKQGST